MAKLNNSFSVKGELSMSEGIVYELKKVNKEEIVEEVDFFGFLRTFDGKTVSISIKEEKEVVRVEDLEAEDEDYEVEEYED